MKKLTIEQFIKKAGKVHDYKYDYSLVEYVNSRTKIKIICPKHEIFEQTPNHHLRGRGCPICAINQQANNQRYTTKEFIQEAKKIHNNKFDYSSVKYIGSQTKVKIECPYHGIFEQMPTNHLRGYGCPRCGREEAGLKLSLSLKEFIERCNEKHNNKYDYSRVIYNGSKSYIEIGCPDHEYFKQKAGNHLGGQGCPTCAFIKSSIIRTKTTEEFIQDAIKVFGELYDYSLVVYINNHTKVKIICPEHEIFEQTPNSHLFGRGCPFCSASNGEIKILNYLKSHNINYKYNETFDECVSPKGHFLKYDFYLPEHNLCIEYDGIQHFISKDCFGGEKRFLKQQKHDKIKNNYCKDNKIKLLRIPYTSFDNIEFLINQELTWNYNIIDELF